MSLDAQKSEIEVKSIARRQISFEDINAGANKKNQGRTRFGSVDLRGKCAGGLRQVHLHLLS